MFVDHSVDISRSLNELNLNPEHINAISSHNYSANAPYHNQHHCFSVALNALEGAKFYGLVLDQQRILFLAGLYHDFEHSEGKEDDKANVANAIKGMEYWCGRLETLDSETTTRIAHAINSTIWPQHLFEGERELLDLILCEADLLQWTSSDVQCYMEGLSVEKGSPVTWEDTIEFVKTHGPNTRWGKGRIDAWLEQIQLKQ